MSERSKILKRIAALLSKTVERGCTPGEAQAAAAAAARLMNEYDLDQSDLEDGEAEPFAKSATKGFDQIHVELRIPGQIIADMTGTRSYKPSAYEGVEFFGRRSDVEVANYFLNVCKDALERELKAFLDNNLKRLSVRRREERSFLSGMSLGLSQTLGDIRDRRLGNPAVAAVIDAKHLECDAGLKAQGMELHLLRPRGRRMTAREAFLAGVGASEKTGFHDAVGDGTAPRAAIGVHR